MTDRVVIFNRFGVPLGEVDAIVVRGQALERKSRAERAYLQVRADITTKEMTRFRNFVMVFSDLVPTWCGVIWSDRTWEDNNITVSVFSCEYLLSFRRTAKVEQLDGQPGQVFTGLLKAAVLLEGLPIWIDPNRITSGGTVVEKEYNRANIFEAVNDLAAESEYYWWFEPLITAGNRLLLRAQWQKNRGIVYHRPLVQGSNFVDVQVSEICNVANRIYATGDVEDWATANEYIAQDFASQSAFGLVEDSVSDHDATAPDEVIAIGTAELTKRKQVRLKISGKVIVTPYPKVGDNVVISLSADSLGYSGGITVLQPAAGLRVKTIAYTPEEDGVNIVADNLYWE